MDWNDLISLAFTLLLLFFFFFRKKPFIPQEETLEGATDKEYLKSEVEDSNLEAFEEEVEEGIQASRHSIAHMIPQRPIDVEPSRDRFVIHPRNFQKEMAKPKPSRQHPRNAYNQSRQRRPSRGALLIRKQHSLKNAIILKEIFGRPRTDDQWH